MTESAAAFNCMCRVLCGNYPYICPFRISAFFILLAVDTELFMLTELWKTLCEVNLLWQR
jgi:hypothetical protein